MLDRAPVSPAETAALYGAVLNRRITIRRPAGTHTGAAVGPTCPGPFQKARVHDISQGGIALVLRRAPAVGELISLQLRNHLLDFTYDLAGEVRHITALGRGRWRVGLAFDRPLDPGELAALT